MSALLRFELSSFSPLRLASQNLVQQYDFLSANHSKHLHLGVVLPYVQGLPCMKLLPKFFIRAYYNEKKQTNGLRYLRWGGDGEAVQPEK